AARDRQTGTASSAMLSSAATPHSAAASGISVPPLSCSSPGRCDASVPAATRSPPRRRLEPDAPASAMACRALRDELEAGLVECSYELHEGIHVSAHDVRARLHALNGRQRKTGEVSELPLIDVQQGARSPHLQGSDHAGLAL